MDICRITVTGPRRRVDVAVPSGVTFGEFFPMAMRACGLTYAELVAPPGGWVLQRLAEAPFEAGQTLASAGVRDGDVVHLRPRTLALPPAVCDDIADELAEVHDSQGRWTVADARRLALGGCAAALLTGALVLMRSRPLFAAESVAAGTVARGHLVGAGVTLAIAAAFAVLLLAGACATARGARDVAAGSLLAWAALPYAFAAGAWATSGAAAGMHHGVSFPGSLSQPGPLAAAAGLAAVGMVAVTGVTVIPDPMLCGPALAALAGVAGAGLVLMHPPVGVAGAAALAAAGLLALSPLAAGAAIRLARFPLPPVPLSAADLPDTEPVPSGVRPRAVLADRLLAGLAAGIGLTGGGAAVILAFAHGWMVRVTLVVLTVALLLRSRAFVSRTARLWLAVPGYLSGAVAAVSVGTPAALAVAGAAAALLVVAGVRLPRRRPSPWWGRLADIGDATAMASLLPLALGVAGVFGFMRGLAG
jgi:type VII secretion integral membrane protein EccD